MYPYGVKAFGLIAQTRWFTTRRVATCGFRMRSHKKKTYTTSRANIYWVTYTYGSAALARFGEAERYIYTDREWWVLCMCVCVWWRNGCRANYALNGVLCLHVNVALGNLFLIASPRTMHWDYFSVEIMKKHIPGQNRRRIVDIRLELEMGEYCGKRKG